MLSNYFNFQNSKRALLLWGTFLSIIFTYNRSNSVELSEFLKYCGYGALTGGIVGVSALILKDKPSNHLQDIAKGTSLGLYGGIAYGLYRHNQESQNNFETYPQWQGWSSHHFPTIEKNPSLSTLHFHWVWNSDIWSH